MPQTGSPIRVIIVDHNDLFRRGLRQILEDHDIEVVSDTADLGRGLGDALAHRPDVIVVEPASPSGDGMTLLNTIVERLPSARLLVLTSAASDEALLGAIAAGAAGYLLKDASLHEIVDGVRATAGGESPLSPAVAARVLRAMRNPDTRLPKPPAPELSPREHEVLLLVAAGRDNDQIADQLYLSPSTVKTHVSRILEKLGAENRTQAAVAAVRRGLLAD